MVLPFQCRDSLVHLNVTLLVRKKVQLLFYQTGQHTIRVLPPQKHMGWVGSVTERTGDMRVPHFLGGYIHFKELFILLPSLSLYPTYSQDSDSCPGNMHGLKGLRVGLLLNSNKEILLK